MTTRQIPWARIFAEGVAIVVSILLAFGIQAWWEGRQADARTDALLAALETEWEGEIPKLDSIIRLVEGNHRAIVAMIEAHQRPELISPESAATLLAGHLWSLYHPSVGALNALLATGIDQIADPDLRMAIAAWQSVLDDAGATEALLSEIGLRDLRGEEARVAESLGQPWSEEYYESLGCPGAPHWRIWPTPRFKTKKW